MCCAHSRFSYDWCERHVTARLGGFYRYTSLECMESTNPWGHQHFRRKYMGAWGCVCDAIQPWVYSNSSDHSLVCATGAPRKLDRLKRRGSRCERDNNVRI